MPDLSIASERYQTIGAIEDSGMSPRLKFSQATALSGLESWMPCIRAWFLPDRLAA